MLAPLSGPYAAGGTSFVQAATLAVEQANAEGGVFGQRVTIVVGDTQGRVDVAKAEALRLVSREKVSALVGAYLSEETVGVMEVAAAQRTVLLVPVAATAEITDLVRREYARYRCVFRVGYSLPQWAEMIAAFLSDRKVRRYAFVGAGIRWNRELGETLERIVAPRGIAPAYTAYYSPGNPAFDTVAVAAAAASPDIVILADPGTELRLLPETAARGGARAPGALHRRGAGGRPAGRLRSALRAGLRAGRRVAGRLPRRDGVRGAVRAPVRGAARRVQRHASLRRRHGARGRLAQGGERGDRSRRAGPRTRDVRGRGGRLPVRRRPPGPLGDRSRGAAGDLRALGTRRRPDRLPPALMVH